MTIFCAPYLRKLALHVSPGSGADLLSDAPEPWYMAVNGIAISIVQYSSVNTEKFHQRKKH